ncbi:TetR family transcriptional regulator [Candidatus Solincola tengchongensis]|uniref:TetR family transcriptional regulator n=1 Tax=Candidatus Solincola tengchongensis TaxID=2900693 RepID=UPI00257AE602|nr:TetR family transcriptional regulator [Candidatus Solincola tengchongensis]
MEGRKDVDASGRRERKKRQTREALEKAALRLFQEKGYDRTTIRDITEEVDVSQRTFFRYFPSKEAVLFGNWEESLELLRRLILERPSEEPVFVTLYRAALKLAEADRENEAWLVTVKRLAEKSRRIGEFERSVIYPGFERVVAEALAERMGVDLEEDPRPRVLAAVSVAAWTTARSIWMESGGRMAISDILSHTFGSLVEFMPESRGTGGGRKAENPRAGKKRGHKAGSQGRKRT